MRRQEGGDRGGADSKGTPCLSRAPPPVVAGASASDLLPGDGVGGEAESGRGEPLCGYPAPTCMSPVCSALAWAQMAVALYPCLPTPLCLLLPSLSSFLERSLSDPHCPHFLPLPSVPPCLPSSPISPGLLPLVPSNTLLYPLFTRLSALSLCL